MDLGEIFKLLDFLGVYLPQLSYFFEPETIFYAVR